MSLRSFGVTAVVLLACCAVPRAQSSPRVWAIVGVRIIDGSGNEPFEGTVVVEGGRIRAAGRTADVPSGAATIEGTGRTVLPGIIDLGVHVAPGADRDAAAQQRRALAALLYSGVTTVALAGPEAARLEALERDGGRADGGPRVVSLPYAREAPSIAEALAGKLPFARSATDAAPAATEIAALVQGNVAILPPLTRLATPEAGTVQSLAAEVSGAAGVASAEGGPGGDFTQAAAVVRALREGRVRLAVRSDAGLPGLAYGWSAHRAAQLLVASGVTPLEALTAATSGGAWGLRVHSDRGFIAPGMRADLLLVHGDPSAAIGDLSRIDRVFLGGVEVDRPALRTMFEARPELAPTAAAPSAPEVKATPTPSKTPASRRTRATVAPAPEAAASASPAPIPAPSPPAPSAPSPTVAATPAPAPESVEVASTPFGEPLIDDFERADERTSAGLPWETGTESGTSTTTVIAGRVIRALRDHALHVTARMGPGPSPYARVSVPLASDGRPRDVRRFRGVRFDARGEGRYRIVFVTRSVADGRFHESYFSGSPNWTPVSVPFATVGQNGRGERVAWTGRDLVEIRFEAARDPGRMAWLELDNLRFY